MPNWQWRRRGLATYCHIVAGRRSVARTCWKIYIRKTAVSESYFTGNSWLPQLLQQFAEQQFALTPQPQTRFVSVCVAGCTKQTFRRTHPTNNSENDRRPYRHHHHHHRVHGPTSSSAIWQLYDPTAWRIIA